MKVLIIFKQWKMAPLCISIETVKSGCFFFVSRVEILHVLGVEVSTGELDRVKCTRSFEAFVAIYLSIARNL
jgi:hypothetical protein